MAVEYLWTDNFSITAQFDYYSPPFHGTGTRVLDKGVTESAIGISYRVLPSLLWQLYGSRTWTSSPGAPPTSRCRPSSPTGCVPDRGAKSVNGARRNLDMCTAICEDEAICTQLLSLLRRTFSTRLFSIDMNTCVQLSCFDKEIVQCLC